MNITETTITSPNHKKNINENLNILNQLSPKSPTLTKNQSFGDEILIDEKYNSTIIAKEETRLLIIDKCNLGSIMFDVVDNVKANAKRKRKALSMLQQFAELSPPKLRKLNNRKPLNSFNDDHNNSHSNLLDKSF